MDVLERTAQECGVEQIKIDLGVRGSAGMLDPMMPDLEEPG